MQRIQAPTAKFLVTIGVGIANLSIGAGAATALEAESDVEAPYGFVGPIGIAVSDSGWQPLSATAKQKGGPSTDCTNGIS